MQSKTIASSDYERPIQVLAELLEIRAVSEKGGASWPVCELVRSHHILILFSHIHFVCQSVEMYSRLE